jgi:hypothetical protein
LIFSKLNLIIDESYALLWRLRHAIYLKSKEDAHLKKLKATIVKRINHGSKFIQQRPQPEKKFVWPILFDLCKCSQVLEDQERTKNYANQLSCDLVLFADCCKDLENFKTKIGLIGKIGKCSQGTMYKIIVKADASCVPY